MFTVKSLKLYQNYFIDFINPFLGNNISQTYIANTSDVTIVHADIDKIKTMFFGVKLLGTFFPMRFISSWSYIKYTRCSISWHPPTAIHKFAQSRPIIIIIILVCPPSIIFLLLRPHHPCIIIKIAARDPHIVITGIGLI